MSKRFWKRLLAALLGTALLVSGIPITASAVEMGETAGWTWKQVDDDLVTAKLPGKTIPKKEEKPLYADGDTVRVSILLEGTPTLERFSGEAVEIASQPAAKAYRSRLKRQQTAMASKISSTVLKGRKLDVVWNLTFAANLISANVQYGQIEQIKALDGVADVVVENTFFPCETKPGNSVTPNMVLSSDMTGSTQAWDNHYRGAGMRIAVVDTGLDLNHQSFDADAFHYALEQDAAETNKTVDDYGLLDQAEIGTNLAELNAYQGGRNVTVSGLYRSAKIPFAYCYADHDFDVSHLGDSQGQHGSHVAGIAAANRYLNEGNGSFSDAMEKVHMTGQAPDAQVLVMKVFGKNGTNDSDYMVAIEDAILLGCDTITLSLGSSYPGVSREAEYAYQDILDSLEEHNAVVAVSAGNSGAWADESCVGALYNDDANFDMVGAPASYVNSLAVASVENNGKVCLYFSAGGLNVAYTEFGTVPLSTLDVSVDRSGTTYDYIFAAGNGSDPAHFSGAGGKVVFLNFLRQGGSLSSKVQNAANAGALACVVYSGTSDFYNMDLTDYTGSAPVVFITKAEGEAIKQKSSAGKITIYSRNQVLEGTQEAPHYTMSYFSSRGVPGSLLLKPEITAPGGNIWSVSGETQTTGGPDQYELMSGTSMAAPQISGIGALVKQYIEENQLSQPGMTNRALVQSLLMSTAIPLKDAEENYWSILAQGAGLVDAAAATQADSYITMDRSATQSYKDGKVKAELGQVTDNTISVKFTIHNLDGEEHQYALGADMFTQALIEDDEYKYMDQATRPLSAASEWTSSITKEGLDFNNDGTVNTEDGQALLDHVVKGTALAAHEDRADVDGDNDVDTHDVTVFLNSLEEVVTGAQVTVPAEGSAEVTGTITLSQDEIDTLLGEDFFPNGFYVEGFVKAEAVSDGGSAAGTSHTIPLLGWYGNWTDPSMFDKYSFAEYSHENDAGLPNPYLFDLSEGGYAIPNRQSNFLTVTYSGESDEIPYIGNPFNPFVVDADIEACSSDAAYLPERNALNNTENGAQLSKWYFSPIRTAAASRLTITDKADGKEYYSQELGSCNGAYYSFDEEPGSWQDGSLCAPLSWAGTDEQRNPLDEGTTVELALTLVPEYYVERDTNTVHWEALGNGASLKTQVTIDNTEPDLVNVDSTKPDEHKQLELTATDNQYVAAFALFDSRGEKLLSYGSPDQTEPGKNVEASVKMDLSGYVGETFLLQVYDYARNVNTYEMTYSEMGPEVQDPDYLVFDDSTGNWYGMKDTGESGLFANSFYNVGAAESVNGCVFSVNAAESGEDPYGELYLYVSKVSDMPKEMGTGQIVAPLGIAGRALDMAYNKADNTLYLLTEAPGDWDSERVLWTVDPLTGESCRLGSTIACYLRTLAVDDSGTFYSFDEDGVLYSFQSTDLDPQTEAELTDILTEAELSVSPNADFYYAASDWKDESLLLASVDYDNEQGCVYSISLSEDTTRIVGYADPNDDWWISAMCALGEEDPDLDLNGAAQAQSVLLSQEELTLLPGASAQLSAIVIPWTLEDRGVTWSSSNEGVAVVNEKGDVTAIGVGTASIIATSNAQPNVTAACYVTVKTIETDLNALIWDENAQIWWSAFNTGSLPAYTKNRECTAQLASATTFQTDGGETGIAAATFDQKNGSVLYSVDPNTLEETPLNGGANSPVALADLAYSPALDLLVGVSGPYFVFYDKAGVFQGGIEWLNSWSSLTAIAYVGSIGADESDLGTDMDIFFLLDTAGNAYRQAFLQYEGNPTYLFDPEPNSEWSGFLGSTGYSAESFFNSAVYAQAADGSEYLFWSQFEGSVANLLAIDMNTGNVFEMGSFPAEVYPVVGLISESIPGNTVVSANLKEQLKHALPDFRSKSLMEKSVSTILPQTKRGKAGPSIQEAGPAEAQPSVQAGQPVVDDTAKTVTVPIQVEQSSNGLFTISYLNDDLTFQSASYGDDVLHSDAASGGEIKLGYAAASAFSGKLADLTFSYTPTQSDRDTTLTLTVRENGTSGESEPVELTATLPGSGEVVVPPVNPEPSGPSGGGASVTPVPPEPSGSEPIVETSTAADGTVTTTTTWPDGKEAVAVITPEGDAAITVTAPSGEIIAKVELPADLGAGKEFEDVEEGQWYKEAVSTVTAYGLFSGTSETKFSPNEPMTRGMLATVLHNLSGKPGYGVGDNSFDDVKPSAWYADPVEWAAQTNVVAGYGNGKFLPNKSVTREQLVTMLYRFARLIGAESVRENDLSGFQDTGRISNFAKDAMQWAVAEGIISGRSEGGKLYIAPLAAATRAEVAKVMARFAAYLQK